MMVSRQETARPLLTPGEVMQLPPADEIVLVSGLHPIRAKKVRYYEHRQLKLRILPPPPPSSAIPGEDKPSPERKRSRPNDDWSALRPLAVAGGRGGDRLFPLADGPDKLEAAISRRLDRLSRQADRLERDHGISVEMLALFVRFWLTVTPPAPDTSQAAAQAKGRERFEGFVEALGRRLASGRSIVREVSEDIPATSPEASREEG